MHRTWKLIRMDTGAHVGDVKHVTSMARLKGIAQKVATTMGVKIGLRPANFKSPKRNPGGFPIPGETWNTTAGGRTKVLAVSGNRVQILSMETGNREWLELREFLATYRLRGPRMTRNPGRSLSSRLVRADRRETRRRVGRRVSRASYKAVRRPARPGNAAQALYYLQLHEARSARRKAGLAWLKDRHGPMLAKNPEDARKLFSVGDDVSISAITHFGRHGTVVAVGKKWVTVDLNLGGRARFLPGHLRLMNPGRRIGGKAGLRAEDFTGAPDSVLDTLAHSGKSRPIRDAAKRELKRRGVRWSGEGMAQRAMGRESNPGGVRIVYNRLLGGWYVVTGPHQTPLNGRFNSKAEAQAWLGSRRNPRNENERIAQASLWAEVERLREESRYQYDDGDLAASARLARQAKQLEAKLIAMPNPKRRNPGSCACGATEVPDSQVWTLEGGLEGVHSLGRCWLPHVTSRGGQLVTPAGRTATGGTPAWATKAMESGRDLNVNPRSNPTLHVEKRGRQWAVVASNGETTTVMVQPGGVPALFAKHSDAEAFAKFARGVQQWNESHGRMNPGLRMSGPRRRADFERFSITLPLEAVRDMSGPGSADEAAEHWARQVIRPRQVTPEALAAELREYGAWDTGQLADDAENWRRILWIAANNISEQQDNPRAPRGAGAYRVLDDAGRVFWQGTASSIKQALQLARKATPVGPLSPPRPWMGYRVEAGDGKPNPKGRELSVPDQHQLKIARDTLKLSEFGARMMGGPNHAEAREIILRLTGRPAPNPKRRKATGARRNPRPFGPARERAEAMFRKWHEFPSETTKRVKVPSRTIPKMVVGLGKVVRIDYISNKWEGKPITYTHSTKRPYPELVTDPDGRQLYLVGGRMKPTADGLVN